MKRFALIGKGIQKSFSPAIHSHCFNILSIEAKYNIIDMASTSQILDVIKLLKEGRLDGINITAPYKQNFIKHIDQLNPRAESIMSINCIHNNNGQLIGNNTDWFGFAKSIENFKNYQSVAILGAGGAVPAMIYYFESREGCPVYIIGRDRNKLDSFNKENVSVHNIDDFNLDLNKCLIINATPFSAKIEWNNLIPKITSTPLYAMDLNYDLKVTEFLNYFNSDVKIKNGLDMLIYQALMSIDIWFNENLSTSINVENLKKNINEQYYNKKNLRF